LCLSVVRARKYLMIGGVLLGQIYLAD
jgi:hypothetical protein